MTVRWRHVFGVLGGTEVREKSCKCNAWRLLSLSQVVLTFACARGKNIIPTPRDQPYSVHENDCQKHFRDLFSISIEWCYYIFSASTHQQPDERRLPLLVSFTVTKSPSHFESLQSFISLAVCLFIVFFSLFQAIVFIFLGVHEKGVILPPFIPRIFFALSPSTVSLTASVCFSPLLWANPSRCIPNSSSTSHLTVIFYALPHHRSLYAHLLPYVPLSFSVSL